MDLRIENLTKKYGSKVALNKFSYQFKPGITGLLGANGAGKSTLMDTIVGNLRPDFGTITYNGSSTLEMPLSFREQLGYLPQSLYGYPNFSILDYMGYVSALKEMKQSQAEKEISELLVLVELYNERKQKIKTLSGGMRQRLFFAASLLCYPKVIILDEPTAGLDPRQRIIIRNILAQLKKDRIIIVATHVVSDVEFIADEIILLKNGIIVDSGSPRELSNKMLGKVKAIEIEEHELNEYLFNYQISSIIRYGSRLHLKIVGGAVVGGNAPATLDDVYLYAMGDT